MTLSASRILLIATRQIGDVLLVTPLLRSLRRAYPQAEIDVLVYANKGGMLVGNPDYSRLISVSEHPTFKEYRILFTQIFRRYDLAISTLAGDRPLVYALLAAPIRVALVPEYRWQDFWKRLFIQRYTVFDNVFTHTVNQNLRLADLLNIPKYYEIVVPQHQEDCARLDEQIPFAWREQAFVVLHLLPMWKYKRWTLTGWSVLAQALNQQNLQIVLTGGNAPEEHAFLAQALEHFPKNTVNLAGKLSFSAVATLLKACCLYIGPDTAVTHLAAATGIPTLALYGPTNPMKWSPYPFGYAEDTPPFAHKGTQRVNNVLLLQADGECVPCHEEGCDRHKQSDSRCLQNLEAQRVIMAAWELLGKTHPLRTL
jgi:heptosyltransferase-3